MAGMTLLMLVSRGQIPPGYYNAAAGKTGEDLQIALYNIIKGHTVLSYTPGVWNAFYSTDKKTNGKVWDMYSDIPGGTPPYEYDFGTNQCGTGGGGIEGDCYSREHSFPKSWFNDDAPMNTDIHHIFPVDQYVNNMHSNLPYAIVGTVSTVSLNGCRKGTCATSGYTGTVFEPIDAYKGDFARAYFYMATRYENVIATWPAYDPIGAQVLGGTSYPAFKAWYVTLLLQWHHQDPVSAKEIARNDSVYKLQNNRNPYIDYPAWADSVWDPAGTLPEPTNHVTAFTAATGSPPYSVIHLTWTDAIGGIIPAGYLIRGSTIGYAAIATPVDGTPVADGGLDKNVGSGIQVCNMTGLNSSTPYYFKIFPYTNSGATINYKTAEPVPAATQTTTPGISVLAPGDIAIIEYGSTDPDKFSFITFKQLNAGTTIGFTDNGFTSPTTVRTTEGIVTYTAPTVIPAGTVVSWTTGTSNSLWSYTVQPAFAVDGDQLFAFQGTWGSGQTLICGMNAGNAGWVTSGTVSSNTSYFPAALTDQVNAYSFTENNGYYNLITNGTANVIGSLIATTQNWTRNDNLLTTPAWSFTLSGGTVITQNAVLYNLVISDGETVTIPPGNTLTVNGDILINQP